MNYQEFIKKHDEQGEFNNAEHLIDFIDSYCGYLLQKQKRLIPEVLLFFSFSLILQRQIVYLIKHYIFNRFFKILNFSLN